MARSRLKHQHLVCALCSVLVLNVDEPSHKVKRRFPRDTVVVKSSIILELRASKDHRAVDARADDCRHLGNGCIRGSRVSHMARGHVGSLFREADRSSINEDVVVMAYE